MTLGPVITTLKNRAHSTCASSSVGEAGMEEEERGDREGEEEEGGKGKEVCHTGIAIAYHLHYAASNTEACRLLFPHSKK